MRIVYMLGDYPKVSNSFIDIEIDELMSRGCDIDIVSMNKGDRGMLSGLPKTKLLYVKKQSTLYNIISGHFFCLIKSPISYIGLVIDSILLKLNYKIFIKYAWVAHDDIFKNADLIYCHFFEPQAELCRVVSKICEIPFIVKNHGTDLLAIKIMHSIIKDSCKTLVVSRNNLLKFSSLFPDCTGKLLHHGCGISLDQFYKSHDLLIKGRIISVGRQIEKKNVDVLLRASARLIKSGIDVHVDIIGDGPHREKSIQLCEKLQIEENVTFHGNIHNSKLCEYYNMSGIYVLASADEGKPVALMEAMACSLPVIATRVGDVPDMIRDGVSGFIIDVGDEDALVDRLKRLLFDHELMLNMGREAKIDSESFDLIKQVDKICDVISKC